MPAKRTASASTSTAGRTSAAPRAHPRLPASRAASAAATHAAPAARAATIAPRDSASGTAWPASPCRMTSTSHSPATTAQSTAAATPQRRRHGNHDRAWRRAASPAPGPAAIASPATGAFYHESVAGLDEAGALAGDRDRLLDLLEGGAEVTQHARVVGHPQTLDLVA